MPKQTSKLTDQMIDRVSRLVAQGQSYRGTARLLGIPWSTFKYWRNRGEESVKKLNQGDELTPAEENYADFWLATEEGLGKTERRCIVFLNMVAARDTSEEIMDGVKNVPLDTAVSTAQWILTHRCGYSTTQKHELSTSEDAGEQEFMRELMEDDDKREEIGEVLDSFIEKAEDIDLDK